MIFHDLFHPAFESTNFATIYLTRMTIFIDRWQQHFLLGSKKKFLVGFVVQKNDKRLGCCYIVELYGAKNVRKPNPNERMRKGPTPPQMSALKYCSKCLIIF